MLAKLKARINIQVVKLGEITDRCRERSTHLIILKISEHDHKDKKKRNLG